jgi:hypothetical protein
LSFLTPIAKTWTSEWGLVANDLAIQIHGGYGYTKDFDVEQLNRDNRLNPIHEGTTGIQGLDFVNRKLVRDGGFTIQGLSRRLRRTVHDAPPHLNSIGQQFDQVWAEFEHQATEVVADREADWPRRHASEILAATGHLVVAWLLLDQASAATIMAAKNHSMQAFADERSHLARFFIDVELPSARRSLQIAASRTDVATNAPAGLFAIGD